MRTLTGLLAIAVIILTLSAAPAGDKKPAASPERDAAMTKLGQFVGGTWSNNNPKFPVEFKYQWALSKTVVRGIGTIDKGGSYETLVEASFGWDPAKKRVYYLDFHGGERIFYGTAQVKGDQLQIDFETLVGPAAKWRSVGTFPDPDTYEFEILSEKDGKWTQAVKQTLKRRKD
jgi:hypothetical protein